MGAVTTPLRDQKWVVRENNGRLLVGPLMDGIVDPVYAELRPDQRDVAHAIAAVPRLIDAATAAYIGLSSGKGSVPFIITMLRVALREAGSKDIEQQDAKEAA